jgi:hypothetical protein
MKNLLSVLLIIALTTPALAQQPSTPDQTDIDPEVMNAILDASKAEPGRDPLEGVSNTTPMQDKAKEAARELRRQNNEVQPTQAAPVRPAAPKGPRREQISQEEEQMLKIWEKEQAQKEKKSTSPSAEVRNKRPIYVPAPVEEGDEDSVLMERDSSKIVVRRMGPQDSLNVKMCFSAGLTVTLDQDIQDEFQRIILDDKIFFDAQEMDNHRGVYVRMKRQVPEGKHWESALRLIRKSDDKTYLINLIGLPCPSSGMTPFPKAVYIKDHVGLMQSNTKALTPEDTIIAMSKGLPRIQKNRIRFYDMLASSGSAWYVFGVEVQYPNPSKKTTMPKMIVLDNLQVSQIPSKLEYLPVHSQKATDARGVSTLRFKLTVNINKNYVLKSRYLHVMFLDEESGHYQYVRVDTLPYFLSLIRRGFEL